MLGSVRVAAQERHQIDRGKATTRRRVRLMNDEGAAIRRLAREEPSVAVWTPIQFSSIWHLSRPFREHSRRTGDARAQVAHRDDSMAHASDAAAIAAILFSCEGAIAA
jgi:hypothetical protein